MTTPQIQVTAKRTGLGRTTRGDWPKTEKDVAACIRWSL